MKHIRLPLTEADIAALQAGDVLTICVQQKEISCPSKIMSI